MSEQEIEVMKQEISLVKEIVFGPEGHPEKSLIVQVQSMNKTLSTMNKVLVSIAVCLGGLLLQDLWTVLNQ